MFSRRLPWQLPENALGVLERRLRAAGVPLFDLTVTNPTAVDLPDRGAALAAALANPAVAHYTPAPLGIPAARAAIARDYAARGVTVAPERIALTASSSESYGFLFKLLCDPGDVVLVPTPSYPLFDYLAALEGVATRTYALAFDGEWHIDWPSVTAALPGSRALAVVNPNNPTGSYLRRGELARLAALAAAHDVALIVDEVFADYAFAPPPDAVPTAAAVPDLPALSFVLGGLSKASGLPQMKTGWIVTCGPPALAEAAQSRLELIADSFLSVGTPVQTALPQLLALGAAIRADITARVAENRATLAAVLGPGSAVTWLPAEAGWSAILRLPAIVSDEAWALRLLADDHVLVQPGYFFDLSVGTTLVVSLLAPPAAFAEALARLVARVAR